MSKRVWLVVALLVALVVPDVALAADTDLMGSFVSGFDAFMGNGQNEQVTPERDFNDSYEPAPVVLRDTPIREYDEDSTTVDYVNGTLDAFNTVNWRNGNFDLLTSVSSLMGNGGSLFYLDFLIPTVALVFLWWGVRKSVRMIMGAFRKGRQSV